MLILGGWKPSRKNVVPSEKPDFVPDYVYSQALAAKFTYNVNWEYWVWQVSQRDNVPINVAEDACIRGIKQEILRQYVVYGKKVGKWYEEFLDMQDIFRKVRHPEYIKKLD